MSDTIFALKRKFANNRNLVPNRMEKLNSNAELVRRLNRANDATMVCLLARFCMHVLILNL